MWHFGDSVVLPHSRRAKAMSSGSGVRFWQQHWRHFGWEAWARANGPLSDLEESIKEIREDKVIREMGIEETTDGRARFCLRWEMTDFDGLVTGRCADELLSSYVDQLIARNVSDTQANRELVCLCVCVCVRDSSNINIINSSCNASWDLWWYQLVTSLFNCTGFFVLIAKAQLQHRPCAQTRQWQDSKLE